MAAKANRRLDPVDITILRYIQDHVAVYMLDGERYECEGARLKDVEEHMASQSEPMGVIGRMGDYIADGLLVLQDEAAHLKSSNKIWKISRNGANTLTRWDRHPKNRSDQTVRIADNQEDDEPATRMSAPVSRAAKPVTRKPAKPTPRRPAPTPATQPSDD